MHLDPATILVVGTFVGVLMTLVLVVTDRGMPRRMPGLRELTAGFAVHTATTVLFALQATPAPRLVSVVLANAAYAAGFVLTFVGYRRFTGRAGAAGSAWALAGATVAVIAWATWGRESLLLRTVVQTVPELVLYPLADWEETARRVTALPDASLDVRNIKRRFVGQATECEIDSAGRILLPQLLRAFAHIEKGAVLLGQGHRLELWSEDQWAANEKINGTLDASALPDIVQQLSF